MRGAALLAGLAALGTVSSAHAVDYPLPQETAALRPGPDRQIAEANCGGCHSADYVNTQPPSLADPKAFWTAEVAKMRKAYGAPIDDGDVAKIVAYLVASYGKPDS